MGISEKILYVLVIPAVFLLWNLLSLNSIYETYIIETRGAVGPIEMFGGYLLPSAIAVTSTWFLLWRLKRKKVSTNG